MFFIGGYGTNMRSSPEVRGDNRVGTIPVNGLIAVAGVVTGDWTEYLLPDERVVYIHNAHHKVLYQEEQCLEVPHVSQRGTGADKYAADCGAACLAMLFRAYKIHYTNVDKLAAQTTPMASIQDLLRVAAHYKLPMKSVMKFDVYQQTASIRAGIPFIYLLDYERMSYKRTKYRGGHYVVVRGYTPTGVCILDPLEGEQHLSWGDWQYATSKSIYNSPAQGLLPLKGA